MTSGTERHPGAIPPAEVSLRAPALRASAWTLGGYAASQLLRFGGNLVLTRLLYPEVFGLMSLVMVFVQGLQMFSDVGIATSIVQNPRGDDPRFLNTAWTISGLRGILLWLASCALASPVASLYEQPMLAWLLPAAALGALFAGLESTSFSTLQRRLRLKSLTIVEFASQGAGTGATIALAALGRAWYGPNHPGAVWAVVAGGLLASATRLVLSHTVLEGSRNRLGWDRDAAHALLRFGRWVFVSTMLTFLAGQSDRLLFGKTIPLDLFGVYGIAVLLATLPAQAALKVAGAVVFPAYSRVSCADRFPSIFARGRRPVLLAGGAAVAGLIAAAPHLVAILYDDRYARAGWIIQFLGAATWFQILESTNGAALLARGRVNWVAAGSASKLAGMFVAIPAGFHVAGFPGAVAGVVLAEVLRYCTSAAAVHSQGMSCFREDTLVTILVGGSAIASIAAGAHASGSSHSPWLGFLGAAAGVAACWLPVALWYARAERRASSTA